MAVYNPKSLKAEEFIHDGEIRETIAYAEANKHNAALIDEILEKLTALGCRNIIFTGISYAPGKTGVVVFENGAYSYYEHEKLANSCHGTGDIYASAFVGALVRGKSACDAAKIAADYTVSCIQATAEEANHWYGAKFEPVLMKLIRALE